MEKSGWSAGVLILALTLALGMPTGSSAQNVEKSPEAPATKVEADSAPAAAAKGVSRATLLQIFRQANPLLWPLALCSVVMLGYALERFMALRRSRVVPREFVDRFFERLTTGKLDRERAIELCGANDSPVSRVFSRVVHYWGLPSSAIREAVSHDTAGELVDLRRNIRVLNGTATIAPLLGLLGTVVGMIESFDALGGKTTGAMKGEALAHGISLALIATAFGLAIAILSVAAYYYLLGRLDLVARELDRQATRVIDLIASDALHPIGDRRPVGGPSDLSRHEPMIRG
jgi:biopolymer transport protein ExbB